MSGIAFKVAMTAGLSAFRVCFCQSAWQQVRRNRHATEHVEFALPQSGCLLSFGVTVHLAAMMLQDRPNASLYYECEDSQPIAAVIRRAACGTLLLDQGLQFRNGWGRPSQETPAQFLRMKRASVSSRPSFNACASQTEYDTLQLRRARQRPDTSPGTADVPTAPVCHFR